MSHKKDKQNVRYGRNRVEMKTILPQFLSNIRVRNIIVIRWCILLLEVAYLVLSKYLPNVFCYFYEALEAKSPDYVIGN